MSKEENESGVKIGFYRIDDDHGPATLCAYCLKQVEYGLPWAEAARSHAETCEKHPGFQATKIRTDNADLRRRIGELEAALKSIAAAEPPDTFGLSDAMNIASQALKDSTNA